MVSFICNLLASRYGADFSHRPALKTRQEREGVKCQPGKGNFFFVLACRPLDKFSGDLLAVWKMQRWSLEVCCTVFSQIIHYSCVTFSINIFQKEILMLFWHPFYLPTSQKDVSKLESNKGKMKFSICTLRKAYIRSARLNCLRL